MNLSKAKIYSITQEEALDIANKWHYQGDYSFYDMASDQDDYNEFINPMTRGEHVYVVKICKRILGYFDLDFLMNSRCEIGLGLHPEFVGKKLGLQFVNLIINYIKKTSKTRLVSLKVACFNTRAICVYIRAGFKIISKISQATNGGIYDFYVMELALI